MAVRKNQRDLSRSDPAKNRPRDQRARFVNALALSFKARVDAKNQARKDAPSTSLGTRLRASEAGNCTRAIAYRIAGVDETNPATIADIWSMELGTLIHGWMDEVMVMAFPNAEVEYTLDIRPELDMTARIDIVVRIPVAELQALVDAGGDGSLEAADMLDRMELDETVYVIVIELKTVNGFKYKKQVMDWQGPPEGPALSAVLQGSLAGLKLAAHEVVIGSLSRETISKGIAERNKMSDTDRFAAEWTFYRDEFMPLAQREYDRLNWLLAYYDTKLAQRTALFVKTTGSDPSDEDLVELQAEAAMRVPRLIEVEPEKLVRITDPTKGTWEQDGVNDIVLDAGKTWHCDYCRFRDRCIGDGA